MNTVTDVAPTTGAERIQALDVIRGFAVLGILLMNIEYFQRPMQAVMLGFDTAQAGLDHAVAWFSYVFVQGKFYTMFSLLFGLGFVIFLDRAAARGAPARWLFSRRLLALAVIGAAHAFLVWTGDILLMYAVVGFVLLAFFSRTPARRLWKWGLGIYLAPLALLWLGAFAVSAGLQSPAGPEMAAGFERQRAALDAAIASGESVYAAGAYAEVVAWRVREWAAMYLGGGLVFFVPTILGLFLIGAAFGRAGVFKDLTAHRALFVRMTWAGYAAGLPLVLYLGSKAGEFNPMVPTIDMALATTAGSLGSLALCLAYVGTVALAQRALQRLAPVGRMALTNYLLHSLVFTLLFYGYGLGLYGEYGRAATTGMALVLFALQVWFSGWWLARYRIGPMEWLWRAMTYGRRPSFRLSQAAA